MALANLGIRDFGEEVKGFQDGYALVFRLSPNDYHRYCYIDSGYQETNTKIKGIFHLG